MTLLVLLCASAARAQIVNVQPMLDKDTKEGFSTAIDGSIDWRTGNTSLALVSGNFVEQFRRKRQLVFVMLHGEFGEQNRAKFVSKDLEHARYRLQVENKWLDGELFAQHDRDDFRRLAVRAIGGLGPRVRLVHEKRVEIAIATSYMLEYEQLATSSMYSDSGQTTLAHRWSSYVVLGVHLSDRLSFTYTCYVQPRFDHFHDVRMLSETQLIAKATKHLSLKTSVTLFLDTEPPSGIEPLDTELKTSLELRF